MKKACLLGMILATGLLTGCATSKLITVSAGDYARTDTGIKVDLGKSGHNLTLKEVTSGGETPVGSQIIDEDGTDYLYFNLAGETKAGQVRQFRLSKGKKSAVPEMSVKDDGKSITLMSGAKEILSYNYAVTPAPKGVRHVYDRSGYIHPAKTPSGFVMTNIQPADHYHHYGIWNPWTHVEYDGKMYDLWNLGDSLGTVRAKDVVALYEGDVVAGFNATLEHVAYTPSGATVIMNEEWRVKATETPDGFLWDFTSILKPCTDKPVIIKAYRYQGFSIRATPKWREPETEMRSSEGLDRSKIDATTGRWLYTNGKGPGVSSGILFLSYPENYNTPEPMRIWTHGDVYMNFCPAKTNDWQLDPGQTYVLRYRVLSYDGEINPEKAERLWKDFAYPPTVTVK